MGCDQGYGSERSPEDELPPILSIPYQTIEPQYHQKPQRNNGTISESDFNFITKGSYSRFNSLVSINIIEGRIELRGF